MVTETLELTVFHCVVKHSSYAKAADELGLSPSGVSRIVTRLEERLGARLVQRTTRKLSLTEAGAAFHARTSQILVDLAGTVMLVGTVVLVGLPTPEMRVELPLLDIFGRGGATTSSWYGDCLPSRDFPMLVDLYLQGRLDLDAFVTEEIPLGGVEEAFNKMHSGGVLRSVVVF